MLAPAAFSTHLLYARTWRCEERRTPSVLLQGVNGCHGNMKAAALRVGLLDCGETLCHIQVEKGSGGRSGCKWRRIRRLELAFPEEQQHEMRQGLGSSGDVAVRATASLAVSASSFVSTVLIRISRRQVYPEAHEDMKCQPCHQPDVPHQMKANQMCTHQRRPRALLSSM